MLLKSYAEDGHLIQNVGKKKMLEILDSLDNFDVLHEVINSLNDDELNAISDKIAITYELGELDEWVKDNF